MSQYIKIFLSQGYKYESNHQYMVCINKRWNILKEKLKEQGYIDKTSLDPSPGIVIDNERKIFFDVPGIHLYWKYRQGRKYPLKELTVDNVLNYFSELIIDRDIELYNKLLRR